MIVDVEKLVATELRDNGVRAVSRTPDKREDGWVRHTLIAAPQDPLSSTYHFVSYVLQFDCFSGQKGTQGSHLREAVELADTVQQVLELMPFETYEDAVVTATRILSISRSPDTDTEPARERYIISARIWAHPKN